jgi:hypothetical protein
MDKHICTLIASSKWLEVGSINFMKIKQSTPIYSMIEIISLNVALSMGVNWTIIHKSNEHQTMLYSGKIVTALLIQSKLLYTYKMKVEDVNGFLGKEIVSAIEYYYEYCKLKK